MNRKIYNGPDDPALPDNIQILDEEARQVYVTVWNATLGLCMGQGGDEQTCFLRATRAATIAAEPRFDNEFIKFFDPTGTI